MANHRPPGTSVLIIRLWDGSHWRHLMAVCNLNWRRNISGIRLFVVWMAAVQADLCSVLFFDICQIGYSHTEDQSMLWKYFCPIWSSSSCWRYTLGGWAIIGWVVFYGKTNATFPLLIFRNMGKWECGVSFSTPRKIEFSPHLINL